MGSAIVVVALYYLLPLDRPSESGSVLLLTAGLIGVALVVAWEVRAILKSQYPAVQAIAALALIVPLFLVLFSTTYYLLERAAPNTFTQHLSRTDALYFTITTFSTVGYGDITAKTEGARVLVIFQMLADILIIGLGVRVLLGAVERGRQRHAVEEQPSPLVLSGSEADGATPA